MKRVKRRLAVRIMSPEDQHHPIMEYFILDWEYFDEEVLGEMPQDARDKWVCLTFPHRLASELKADLRD